MKTSSIFDLLITPWKFIAIYTAIRLEIFTLLAGKNMLFEELAEASHTRPLLLKPLLDACVSLGLLVVNNGRYINSHFSQVYLVEGTSKYVGDLIRLQFHEMKKWSELYDLVRQNQGVRTDQDPAGELHRTFIKGMHNLGMLSEAEALKNALNLSDCRSMVDAGGGSGLYSVILLRKFPKLRSVILDVEQTLPITEDLISEFPERERISLRQSDITKDQFGENLDVVLLSDVIYDLKTAKSVLKNAWLGLGDEGLLIIRGYYSDPEASQPLFGALFALGQLVFDPDREIMTISSLEREVRKIGFCEINKAALTEYSFVLTAQK